MESTDGILLIDKPEGITSFDVIRRLRRALQARVMGHAGTLDPRATGLLIVAVGDATNRIARYTKLPKTYQAEILFGAETTTGDLDGIIIKQAPVGTLSADKVRTALRALHGIQELPVPAYSAIKVNGNRLYDVARALERQGKIAKEEMQLPLRLMEIISIKLSNFKTDGERARAMIEMDVSSGTYVRSIAEEIGKRVGVPATLASLRRTSIGPFSIEQATPLEDFDKMHAAKNKSKHAQ